MTSTPPSPRSHAHVFDTGSSAAERGTRLVLAITLAMIIIEIVAGWWYNSMALLADGWHMGSHALAIGHTALAYATARRYAQDPRFAFGSWKIEILAGFASALFLLGVAALMLLASIDRLRTPQPIHYQQALVIAVVGLVVNIVCAVILGRAQDDALAHGHGHGHAHGHGHNHDLNLKSAYLHVMADAATSVLAIAALAGGLLYGWGWLDPVMGIVGAALVANWARGLIKETSAVLLDREMDHPVVQEIREAAEGPAGDTQVVDLHVWRVGRNVFSCALTVETRDATLTPETVRMRPAAHPEVAH
jgi:cation diffusion facilitator family transporter